MVGKIVTQLVIDGKNKASAAFKEADEQLNKLGVSAKSAGAFIAGALSVGAISAFVKTSIDAADAAKKSAQAVGLAIEEYTALEYAAKLAGVGSEELNAGLSRLNRTIDEAANGGETQLEAFDRLGISILDASGKLKTSDQILAEVADKFQSMPDGIQKSALAMELFGKSGARLIPLLNGGAAGLEELRKEAEALGLVISDEAAASAEVFNDNLSRLGEASAGAGNKIAAELLPALADLSALMVDLNKNTEATSILADVLGGALKVLATAAIILGVAFTSAGGAIAGFAAAAAAAAQGNFAQAKQILTDAAADYESTVKGGIQRIGDLWSGAGESTAAAAVEQKKQQAIITGDIKRTTDEIEVQLKRQVKAAQDALKERVDAERKAASQLEAAKKAQLDTEKRYSEALAKLRAGGTGEASFGQFQTLKVAARNDVATGNVEGAKEKAQAALEVLNKLAAAGENTYGFEGFIKELQAIEQQADQINVDKAQQSFDDAKAKATELKSIIDELKSVKLTLDLPPSELERIKGMLQQLRVVITPTVALPKAGEADADGYVFVPNNPPPPGYASGGHIRGAGTGTSDSILARLSNGEYVLRAAAVRQYGTALLDRMNGLQMPRFADGGLVSVAQSISGAAPGRDLGRVDLNIGGESFNLLADGDQFDRLLRRTATKFGRTKK